MGTVGSDDAGQRPQLRVISGDATPEDIAALLAVLSATGGAQPRPQPQPSAWGRPATRGRVGPSPDGWKRSGAPG